MARRAARSRSPQVDLPGRCHLLEVAGALVRRPDVRHALEVGPAIGLELELGLPLLQPVVAVRAERAAGRAASVVPGLERVLPEVLLRHRLEPRRAGRAGHELAGDRERLVDGGAVLGREPDAEARPLLVLLSGAHRANGLLEGADGLGASALHPRRLGLAHRYGQHGLGVSGADLPRADGGAKERARFQLARELGHRLGGPLRHVQDLASVVAQAREAETDEPVSDEEGRQAVPDREVQGSLDAGRLREELLADVGLGQAAVDQRAKLGRRARLRRRRRRGERQARRSTRERGGEWRRSDVHRTDPATGV